MREKVTTSGAPTQEFREAPIALLIIPNLLAAETLSQLEFDRKKSSSQKSTTTRVVLAPQSDKYDPIKQPIATIVRENPKREAKASAVAIFRVEDFTAEQDQRREAAKPMK